MTRNFEVEKNNFIEYLNDLHQLECITDLKYDKQINMYEFKMKHCYLDVLTVFEIDKEGIFLKIHTNIQYTTLQTSLYLFNSNLEIEELDYINLFKKQMKNFKILLNKMLELNKGE